MAYYCNRNTSGINFSTSEIYRDLGVAGQHYLLKDDTINTTLLIHANGLTNSLIDKINTFTFHFDDRSDYTIYSGYCGAAYMHFFNYLNRKDVKSYKICKVLIKTAISNLKGECISFLKGDAGPLALGVVLYGKRNKHNITNRLIKRLMDLTEKIRCSSADILVGRAGYIYALLFVNKYFDVVIPDEHIRNEIDYLLYWGKCSAANTIDEFPPLRYEWHAESYLGAGHGIAGILYVLLCCKYLLTQSELDKLIKPTLQWLIFTRITDGNFPIYYGNNKNTLVQWCHGAPGFVYLFALASQIYDDDNYMRVALDCGDIVWNRGLLTKGFSICHGVSGNAYTFVRLYQSTGELKHLHRLACFMHWCITQRKALGRKHFSLFQGITGLAYFLNDIQDITNAAFPAYQLEQTKQPEEELSEE